MRKSAKMYVLYKPVSLTLPKHLSNISDVLFTLIYHISPQKVPVIDYSLQEVHWLNSSQLIQIDYHILHQKQFFLSYTVKLIWLEAEILSFWIVWHNTWRRFRWFQNRNRVIIMQHGGKYFSLSIPEAKSKSSK